MGHVQVDSEMNVHCCHSCRLKSQVAGGAVCQVSHGIEFQGGEIHTLIDYNILVRLITGLEIEECTCLFSKKSTTILVLKVSE